jgi:hypothetical protein
LLLTLSAALCGCASQSRLTVAPTRSREIFSQRFDKAFSSRDEAGDYRIVLLDDGLNVPQNTGPLHPTATPPVRQVVRIRLFWRPMLGTKPDFPSASNAAIDWYVMGTGSREAIDMIHYQGVGFVSVRTAAGGATVTIHTALLNPVASCGRMADPIGVTKLSGTFFALNNAPQAQLTWDQTLHSAQLALDRAGLAAEASAGAR